MFHSRKPPCPKIYASHTWDDLLHVTNVVEPKKTDLNQHFGHHRSNHGELMDAQTFFLMETSNVALNQHHVHKIPSLFKLLLFSSLYFQKGNIFVGIGHHKTGKHPCHAPAAYQILDCAHHRCTRSECNDLRTAKQHLAQKTI